MELLDTDVLIDVYRGHPPAIEWFTELEELPAVPGFVVMELIQDANSKAHMQEALDLVSPLQVLWPTPTHCQRALDDFRSYRLSHSLGLLDALIAACAIGHSATLLSFNVKHYRVVPGLAVKQPYDRA